MKDDWPMLEGWTTLAYLAAEFPAYTYGNTRAEPELPQPRAAREDGGHAPLPHRRVG